MLPSRAHRPARHRRVDAVDARRAEALGDRFGALGRQGRAEQHGAARRKRRRGTVGAE